MITSPPFVLGMSRTCSSWIHFCEVIATMNVWRQIQRLLHTRAISRKESRRTICMDISFPAIVPRTGNRTITRNDRDGDGDQAITFSSRQKLNSWNWINDRDFIFAKTTNFCCFFRFNFCDRARPAKFIWNVRNGAISHPRHLLRISREY